MDFLHFGMRVNDIHATSALLQQVLDVTCEPVKQYTVDLDYGAGPVQSTSLVTHALTRDNTEIELVQALDGPSPDSEVLGDREGVSHVAYRVADLADAMARAEAGGLRRVCTFESEYVDFAFYAGAAMGGMLLQLVTFHGER